MTPHAPLQERKLKDHVWFNSVTKPFPFPFRGQLSYQARLSCSYEGDLSIDILRAYAYQQEGQLTEQTHLLNIGNLRVDYIHKQFKNQKNYFGTILIYIHQGHAVWEYREEVVKQRVRIVSICRQSCSSEWL